MREDAHTCETELSLLRWILRKIGCPAPVRKVSNADNFREIERHTVYKIKFAAFTRDMMLKSD